MKREYPDSARGPTTLDRRLSLGLLSSWLESRAPSFPFCPLLGFQHKAQIFREHGLGKEIVQVTRGSHPGSGARDPKVRAFHYL